MYASISRLYSFPGSPGVRFASLDYYSFPGSPGVRSSGIILIFPRVARCTLTLGFTPSPGRQVYASFSVFSFQPRDVSCTLLFAALLFSNPGTSVVRFFPRLYSYPGTSVVRFLASLLLQPRDVSCALPSVAYSPTPGRQLCASLGRPYSPTPGRQLYASRNYSTTPGRQLYAIF